MGRRPLKMAQVKVEIPDTDIEASVQAELVALRRKVRTLENKNAELTRQVTSSKMALEVLKDIHERMKYLIDCQPY